MVLAAFAAMVFLGGSNAVAVRFVLMEMGPFTSAAVRFAIAGVILAALVVARGRRWPRGEQLRGSVLFGVIGFGFVYFCLYLAIRDAPAGTTMVILSVVPLLTAILAALQGVERLRWLGLAGAVIASLGIVIVAADQVRLDVPVVALALLLAGAVGQAEQAIVAKRFPPGDPVAANAVAMLIGAAMLAVAALVAGEPLVVPARLETWLAMGYLIGPGSIAVFILVLFILERWTASATSYSFLLLPLVAITLGSLLLHERVEPSFLLGGAIVVAGVYLGVVYRPARSRLEPRAGA